MYDITIIGGGPGGYKCAELLAKTKNKVALIEEKNLGGICLNQGCIPFKSYLHFSHIREECLKMSRNGIFNLSKIETNQAVINEDKNMIIKCLQQSIAGMLKNSGVEIIYSKAHSAIDKGESICIETDGMTIETRKLIIATGSEERRIFDDPSIKYSKDILELDYLPPNIVIIGGGVIGLEAASYFADLGSKVSIIEATGQVGGSIDGEISTALLRILRNKRIDIYTNSNIYDICDNNVNFLVSEEHKVLHTDYILCSIGRIPKICKEITDPLGICATNNGIIIDDSCRTSNPKVYACGDVTGKLMLAHTAYKHAKIITDNIANKQSTINYALIPKVIYTNPEVLNVGLTEEECKKNNIKYKAKSLPMTYSGKYFAENGKDGALAKMIIDDDNRIIGFHMIGNGSSEISTAVELMILKKMCVEDIKDLVIAHPTYSEIIAEIVQYF